MISQRFLQKSLDNYRNNVFFLVNCVLDCMILTLRHVKKLKYGRKERKRIPLETARTDFHTRGIDGPHASGVQAAHITRLHW